MTVSSRDPVVGRLTPEATGALLRSAQHARANNNPAKARAILRALAERRPDDLRVWMLLATVAEDRIEQARAFERILALSPEHQVARRGLERLRAAGVPEVLPPAAPADARALAPPAPEEEEDDWAPVTLSAAPPEVATRRPPLLLIGAGFLALATVVVLLAVRPWETRMPQGQIPPVPVPGLQSEATPVAAPTAVAAATTASVASTPAVTAVPSPTAAPTPTRGLAIGQFVPAGIWRVSVLNSAHIRTLDGSIGGQLQPQGRFVLALVTVVNNGSQPARLPRDLLTLSDASGQRYQPLPGASAAYLNTYGRGQFGDFSADENIPPNAGNVSVPLIFDVPERASGLELRVSTALDGWSVR
ncbi:MAG: tetratricopeptide repeat protein [Roseiflexaceae bacterium]